MTKPLDEAFHELMQRLVLWAAVAFWALEAYMNFRFGWRTGGIGLGGVLLAAAFFAAYLPVSIAGIKGRDQAAWAKRLALALPLALCVVVSQVAGWFTLGTLLADGMAARQTQASGRSTAADALKLAREERAAIGTVRPISAIEAELQRELLNKSSAFPDGRGPKALALEAELATAKRAAELDARIPKLVAGLEGRAQVAEGTPHLDVLVRATGAAPQEVAFWVPVGLTAVVGLFANFGFLLAGVGRSGHGSRRPEPDPLEAFDWGPRRLTGPADHQFQHYPGERSGTAREASSTQWGRDAVEPVVGAAASDVGAQPAAPYQRGPSENGSASSGGPSAHHMHGAPINISVALPAAGVGGGLGERLSHPPAAEQLPGPAPRPLLPAPGAGVALKAHATASPPAPQRPVQRNHVQEIVDHLLTFRAACVLDAAGGIVPAQEMYERYVAWAGERAISAAAFDTMFGELAGVARVSFGGVPHYRGVVLNREPRLSAVGE
ncbi:MAG: hypothetical protein WCZ28_06090 [Burkholderiaceae bacterium]